MYAADTNPNTPDGSVLKLGFDALKIGKKPAAFDAGDLLANAAFLFGHTAPGNRVTADRLFPANFTCLHFFGCSPIFECAHYREKAVNSKLFIPVVQSSGGNGAVSRPFSVIL